MKTRTLIILSVLTVVAVIAALRVSQTHAPVTGRETTVLLPDLADKINQISRIEVRHSGQTLTLQRQATEWRIVEAGNYPARSDRIKPMLLALADLKILAEKTRNPDYYSRLGVEDPDAENADSTLLTLQDDSGAHITRLIVGKASDTRSTAGDPAVYVRLPGEVQSFLVDARLNVSTRPSAWFKQQLFDIRSDRLRKVTITEPDGTETVLARDTAAGGFAIEAIAQGKALVDGAINRVSTALQNVSADNVQAADAFQFPDEHFTVTAETFDGLVATITAAQVDDKGYLKARFDYAEALPQEAPAADTVDEEAAQKTPDVRQEAADLNQAVSGWVYQIPQYKFESFVTRRDDLLGDVKTD